MKYVLYDEPGRWCLIHASLTHELYSRSYYINRKYLRMKDTPKCQDPAEKCGKFHFTTQNQWIFGEFVECVGVIVWEYIQNTGWNGLINPFPVAEWPPRSQDVPMGLCPPAQRKQLKDFGSVPKRFCNLEIFQQENMVFSCPEFCEHPKSWLVCQGVCD